MSRKLAIFSVVAIIGVILDQVTKFWVRGSEAVNSAAGIEVIPHFFSIVHAENPGAAFSMFGDLPEMWRVILFVGFTIVAVVVVGDMYRKLPKDDRFMAATLGLIISGAIGNVLDRLLKPLWGDKSTVTDFLRFYTDDPAWMEFLGPRFSEYPTFNVADISLVVGVILFLIHYLFIEDRSGSTDEDDVDEDELDETMDDDAVEEDVDDVATST
ncbi:MAG: signal peptidase II [Myxococcota bacterium]